MASRNKNSGKSRDYCGSDCTDDSIAIAADKVATIANSDNSTLHANKSNSNYKIVIFNVKEHNDLFETCDYFDVNSFNNSFSSSINNLFVIHLNIRSLQKNMDKFSDYIRTFDKQPDITALLETKLKPDTMYSNIDLDGYAFKRSDSATHSSGVCMHAKEPLTFATERNLDCDLALIEKIWIDLKINFGPIITGVVY